MRLAALLVETAVAWGSANTLLSPLESAAPFLLASFATPSIVAGVNAFWLLDGELIAAAVAVPHVVAARGAAATASARVQLPSPKPLRLRLLPSWGLDCGQGPQGMPSLLRLLPLLPVKGLQVPRLAPCLPDGTRWFHSSSCMCSPATPEVHVRFAGGPCSVSSSVPTCE